MDIARKLPKNLLPLFIASFLTVVALLPAASSAKPLTSYSRIIDSQVITNVVPLLARPLPLADVRLTGGPLKHAQDLDAAYLLSLDPDRMLYYLRAAGRFAA